MQRTKIQKLITKAQNIMRTSADPVHDIRHVTRVVEYTQKLSHDLHLTEHQQQALGLAAWWHDAGRTVTKNPSFIWMVFFDDIISACMLYIHIVRYGLFDAIASIAIRLILCKSLGTGTIFTKILLRKKMRILLDVLKDADNLDLLHIERFEIVRHLSYNSTKNQLAFKFLIWFNLHTKTIYMRTTAARTYIKEIVIQLLNWVKQQEIYVWHVQQFGEAWAKKTIRNLERLLDEILLRDIQYKWS